MELRLGADRATDAERAAVDAIVAPAGPVVAATGERFTRGGPHRAHERRHLLLPALQALQQEAGWISPGAINHVAEVLGVPPAEAYGVATFYDLFATEPQPETVVRVCDDIACRLRGTTAIDGALAAEGLGAAARHHSPCLGLCDHGGAALVQRAGAQVRSIAAPAATPPVVEAGAAGPRLLARVGRVDPASLDEYRAQGGYRALARAIEMGPDAVIEAVFASGLRGRGGAAFPTGAKWRAVADEHGRPRHVVANADESEPGTFKDRVLMEGDPFALVESLTIAGLAVGARQGWIYIRGEYPVARSRLEAAIASAREAGLLGADVAGSGAAFDIELRIGAGAYICGEETALFNSMEGFRGEPRSKPPFPTTHGLFGEPTVVNNVETLLNVPAIVLDGADAYRAAGTVESPGTRLFCLSGHVARPGLYEHALGVTVRAVIERAGGVADGRALQAVLLGGAAGTFVGPDDLDVELSFEGTRAAGVALGSGVVMLFDDRVDLHDTLTRLARFFRDESCGQCVPCRVGTQRVVEWLASPGAEHAVLDDLMAVMTDASICGLGQTATSALRSARTAGLALPRRRP
jgi:NADH-quinone oxidoreductase subunit F